MRPELLELIRRTRAASGVPEVPTDPATLETVGHLIELHRSSGRAVRQEREAA